MRGAAFKYTFPITKAEERADGVYITGLASGPEIDAEGERVTVDAIASFSRQIELAAEMGDPVPYRDAHAKDGVLRDLGVVTKAWITPDFHLGVEVRLDVEDNPAALSLWKQLKKGKQFGMSVAGHVLDWADEFVSEVGQIVRTYKDVMLEEISNTTRPAWYPSFGTVLSKAIKDAEDSGSDAAVGESVEDELQTEQETVENPAVDENTEQPEVEETEAVTEESAEEPAEEAAAEGEATEEPAAEAVEGEAEEAPAEDAAEEVAEEEAEGEVAEEAEEAAEEPVAEAVAEETTEPLSVQDAMVGLAAFMNEMLTRMGVAAPAAAPVVVAKTVSQDENEPTFEKALSEATAPLVARIEELSKSLGEATARIEALENSPAGDDSPELVEKHNLTHDDIAKAMENMTPSERLRMGLRFGMKPSR